MIFVSPMKIRVLSISSGPLGILANELRNSRKFSSEVESRRIMETLWWNLFRRAHHKDTKCTKNLAKRVLSPGGGLEHRQQPRRMDFQRVTLSNGLLA